MNIGKSINMALAAQGNSNKWLSGETGISTNQLSRIKQSKYGDPSGSTIRKLADAFNMQVSEFVALGEDV